MQLGLLQDIILLHYLLQFKGKINRLYQEKSKEIVKMASTYLVKPMTDIKIDALIVNQEKS